jgi:ParB family chromosome partitioning protein
MIKPPTDSFYPGCDEHKLTALANSIEHYGVVTPLVLTREPLELWYTIVAGRRRYTAAKRVGLDALPALIVPPDQATPITLLENMHREPASCFEEAALLDSVLQASDIDDVQLAKQFGLTTQQVAEKRKLLTLDPESAGLCRAAGIDQEMANRILSLPKSERDKLFFGLLNPARDLEERAWLLRDRLGLGASQAPRRTIAIKDVRIFFNTIDKALDLMKQAGVGACSERHDYDSFSESVVRIPNQNAEPAQTAAGAVY